MPFSHEVKLDSAVWNEVISLASEREIRPEVLLNEAVRNGLVAMREEEFWAERRRGADIEAALRLLRRTRDETPSPEDEIPEHLREWAAAKVAG